MSPGRGRQNLPHTEVTALKYYSSSFLPTLLLVMYRYIHTKIILYQVLVCLSLAYLYSRRPYTTWLLGISQAQCMLIAYSVATLLVFLLLINKGHPRAFVLHCLECLFFFFFPVIHIAHSFICFKSLHKSCLFNEVKSDFPFNYKTPLLFPKPVVLIYFITILFLLQYNLFNYNFYIT